MIAAYPVTIAKLRAKIATALDMGDAGKFVVLTREEAEAVLAEIDALATAGDDLRRQYAHTWNDPANSGAIRAYDAASRQAVATAHPNCGDPRARHLFQPAPDRDTCFFCGLYRADVVHL